MSGVIHHVLTQQESNEKQDMPVSEYLQPLNELNECECKHGLLIPYHGRTNVHRIIQESDRDR